MSKTEYNADYWIYSDLELQELFDKFRVRFQVNDDSFIHDCENVWEWFEGRTADGTPFDIARPHEDLDEFGIEKRPVPNAPVVFKFSIIDSAARVTDIGTNLATAVGTDVH